MQDELTSETIQGSEPVYRDLYELWYGKAYRIGKSVCGSRSLAEDAVQEALIRFWRTIPRLKEPEAAQGYFLKIVANEARRIRAGRKARPEQDIQGAGDIPSAMVPDEEREQRMELRKAVDRLPEAMGSAVKLHYYGGFSESETAELLGLSLPSLKMRLVRARRKLKSYLEHEGYKVMGGLGDEKQN